MRIQQVTEIPKYLEQIYHEKNPLLFLISFPYHFSNNVEEINALQLVLWLLLFK